MNMLTFFLWAADAVEKLGGAAGVFACILAIAFIPSIIGVIAVGSCAHNDREAEAFRPTMDRLFRLNLILFFVASFLYVVTPKQQTMFLMAGSELGERIANSETAKGIANDAYDSLKAWLKQQTQPAAK